MLEVFQVADKMEACMRAIEKRCTELDGVGEEKVDAEVEYDKEMEIALAALAEQDVPVTIRRKMAEGTLARNGVTTRMKMAEIRYKALHTKIDAAKSALDGWRSYNRHLDIGAK